MPSGWRDSAISQLDRIASANEQQIARARRQRMLSVLALGGVAVLVMAMLWRPAPEEAPMLATQRPAPARVNAAPAVAVPPATPSMDMAVADAAPKRAVESMAAAQPAADEVARQARAAQQQAAETRRAKANQLAQERARTNEEAQRVQRAQEQQQQQADAEHARQRHQLAERERAAVAERERQQAALLAQSSRRDVQSLCASSGGGFIGEQFCLSRECRKAEHQADAVCVRLHEIEVARLQRRADH